MVTEIKTDGISQESVQKFIEGMVIQNVAWYVNPSSIHLFLTSEPLRGPRSLLTISAMDDGTLHIGLQGPHVPESPHDKSEWPEYESLQL